MGFRKGCISYSYLVGAFHLSDKDACVGCVDSERAV